MEPFPLAVDNSSASYLNRGSFWASGDVLRLRGLHAALCPHASKCGLSNANFFVGFVAVTAGGLWHESQWGPYTLTLLPGLRRKSKATFCQMCQFISKEL